MPPIRPVKSFDLFVSKHVSCPPITVTNTTTKIVASPLLANTCILLKLWPLSPSHMEQEIIFHSNKTHYDKWVGIFFLPIFNFTMQAHQLYELGKFDRTILILGICCNMYHSSMSTNLSHILSYLRIIIDIQRRILQRN